MGEKISRDAEFKKHTAAYETEGQEAVEADSAAARHADLSAGWNGGATGPSPRQVLSMQRTSGNSFVRRLLQRARATAQTVFRAVLPTATARPTPAQIDAMTLQDFQQQAQTQADWFNSPDITDTLRRRYRALLTFAAQPSVLSGCGPMTVSSLLAAHVINSANNPDPVIARDLQVYSNAVSQTVQTIQITTQTTDPAVALRWGAAIRRLESTGLSTENLYNAFKQPDFETLVNTAGLLDKFIRYVRNPGVRIEADDGKDVSGFILLSGELDPLALQASPLHTRIKNFQRFEGVALTQLQRNFALSNQPQAARKPLTLILHSARDHNGAFNRDANLTAVITNTNILTLLIEGRETLADVTAELPGLAAAYGQNGRIDQVMIAGHGSARSIELGAADNQAVDLDSNAVDSNALFDEILRLMPNDPAAAPHRRIIFNACLTNSNTVTVPLNSGDPAAAAAEVRLHIGANSSLTTYLQARARSQGLNNINVRGANGSFGTVGLIDAGDGLDIISTPDPAITSDKIDYVRDGTEPEGVLHAVLECWAGVNAPDPVARRTECQTRMQARVTAGAAGWRPTIINTLFSIILARHWANGEMIRVMADTAYALSDSTSETECRVPFIANTGHMGPGQAVAGETANIFTPLIGIAPQPFIQLVMNEVWTRIDATKQAAFMATLSTFTGQTASDYIDEPFIAPELPTLLPTAGPATRTQLLLAAIILSKNNAQVDARAFLTRVVDMTTRTFPPALGMTALLAGRPSENTILQILGLAAGGPAAPPASDVNANMDLDGDGTNETYVEPLPGKRGNSTGVAHLFDRPDPARQIRDQVYLGQRLFIIGQTGMYYAIHNPYQARQTVFVEKTSVNAP